MTYNVPFAADGWDPKRADIAVRGMPPRKPRVSMLVPYRTEEPSRIRNWKWLKAKWKKMWPELEIIEGTDDGHDPFSACMAINDAASRATGDVFVIADADVYMSAKDLKRHAQRVYTREVPWMLPWDNMICLSEADTNTILEQTVEQQLNVTDDMKKRAEKRHGRPPGSLQLVPREAFELVGGYDERFRGWGGGDSSFFWAVETLFGRHQRGDGVLVALWHERMTGKRSNDWVWPGQDRWTHKDIESRYKSAWRDPRMMREVLRELREYRRSTVV